VIILAKWPAVLDEDGTFPFTRSEATGDRQGRFQIGGLAPGEYRALALSPSAGIASFILSRPGMDALMRALASAEKVTLSPGGTQDVSLKVTEP
jgi:hypothetical protein